MKNSYSVIKIEWSIKFIRCILKLLPLQGASLIALYPGRCLGLRASAPSGRAAYMGFCPFRACCLYGLLPLQGIAAYMGFCPFRALQLIWAAWTSGRCCYGLLGVAAYMGFWPFRALLSHANFAEFSSCMVEITQHALLYGWNYPACPSVRLKLPSMPFCTVEFTLHALLYGWNYPTHPSVWLKLPSTPWKGRSS